MEVSTNFKADPTTADPAAVVLGDYWVELLGIIPRPQGMSEHHSLAIRAAVGPQGARGGLFNNR